MYCRIRAARGLNCSLWLPLTSCNPSKLRVPKVLNSGNKEATLSRGPVDLLTRREPTEERSVTVQQILYAKKDGLRSQSRSINRRGSLLCLTCVAFMHVLLLARLFS